MNQANDIRAAVTDDLTFDPDADASGITVENRDGEVVLAGSVRTATSPSPVSCAPARNGPQRKQ
jgi:osmotically-inducible protein OsmY